MLNGQIRHDHLRPRARGMHLAAVYGGLLLGGSLVCGACSDSSAPNGSQQSAIAHNLLWQLQVRPRGITMAVGTQQQLMPTAINILGDTMVIPVDTPVTYSVTPLTDTNKVAVSAQGVLTAKTTTTVTAPVTVIGTWQHAGVTVSDTVFVGVTTVPSKPVASISIQPAPYPADSTWIGQNVNKKFTLTARAADGTVIPNVYAYFYSQERRTGKDNVVKTPKTLQMKALETGPVWLFVEGTIYGVPLIDSVRMTVTDFYDFGFGGFNDDAFGHITPYPANGVTIYLPTCGEYDWRNISTSVPVVNVIFDDPNATGVCVPGDVAGDIIGLGRTTIVRKFKTPGVYSWHAVHSDGTPFSPPLTGAVQVRDTTFYNSL